MSKTVLHSFLRSKHWMRAENNIPIYTIQQVCSYRRRMTSEHWNLSNIRSRVESPYHMRCLIWSNVCNDLACQPWDTICLHAVVLGHAPKNWWNEWWNECLAAIRCSKHTTCRMKVSNNADLACSGVFVVADVSVRSPCKLSIFAVYDNIHWVKVSQLMFSLIFKTKPLACRSYSRSILSRTTTN